MTDFNWTATFGEVKTAAQWTDLGDNDRALKDGTGIDDGAILPEHLVTGAGTSWDWQSFTPTWTGLTIGNATQTNAYAKIGKTIVVRINVVLGSTSSVGGVIQFTLPATARSSIYAVHQLLGNCRIGDSGVADWLGWFSYVDTTHGEIYVPNGIADTRYVQATTGKPGTWNTNDTIQGFLIYEAA